MKKTGNIVKGVKMTNYFEILSKINVNSMTEKKNGLTYLSWAYAWQEVKKLFPEANYKIYENAEGWNYFTDGRTGWVKTGVTINNIEHIEYLPIMDYRNKSITLDKITSFDVNKAIQRSLTKAVARHGLGLYIYAGEDLPEAMATTEEKLERCKEKVKETQKDIPTDNDVEIFKGLADCKTLEELKDYYSKNYAKVKNKNTFVQLKDDRKNALTAEV